MRKSLLFLLLSSTALAGPNMDAFDSALVKYCIPKDTATCDLEHTPVYDGAAVTPSKCRCANENMAYNTNTRQCEYCKFGSESFYAVKCAAPPICDLGYMLAPVPDGESTTRCMPGYYYFAM